MCVWETTNTAAGYFKICGFMRAAFNILLIPMRLISFIYSLL